MLSITGCWTVSDTTQPVPTKGHAVVFQALASRKQGTPNYISDVADICNGHIVAPILRNEAILLHDERLILNAVIPKSSLRRSRYSSCYGKARIQIVPNVLAGWVDRSKSHRLPWFQCDRFGFDHSHPEHRSYSELGFDGSSPNFPDQQNDDNNEQSSEFGHRMPFSNQKRKLKGAGIVARRD